MGFMDGLGKLIGAFAAKGQYYQDAISLYRPEYEYLSNNELKREYAELKEKQNKMFCSEEVKMRFITVRNILSERKNNI